MSKRPTESEILTDMLRTATERWGADKVKELRPSLETMARAIWEVESYQLAPEEELASATTILQQRNRRKESEER